MIFYSEDDLMKALDSIKIEAVPVVFDAEKMLTLDEQQEIVKYMRDRKEGNPIDAGVLPPWLAELETLRYEHEHKKAKKKKARIIVWLGKSHGWTLVNKDVAFLNEHVVPEVGDIVHYDSEVDWTFNLPPGLGYYLPDPDSEYLPYIIIKIKPDKKPKKKYRRIILWDNETHSWFNQRTGKNIPGVMVGDIIDVDGSAYGWSVNLPKGMTWVVCGGKNGNFREVASTYVRKEK